jgi:translocation and assembly module TamB
MPLPVKHLIKKVVRLFVWILGGILVLLIVIIILIQIPAVQNYAKDKAVTYLQRKLGTKISIQTLRIRFPKQILLEGIYVEDQHKDTLLSAQSLKVDLSMFRLLKKEIAVTHIALDGVRAKVYRQGTDTVFNYDFIVKAFSPAPDTTLKPVDTSGGFTYKLGDLKLYHIVASFKDDITGNEAFLELGNLRAQFGRIDPAHNVYGLPSLLVDSLSGNYRQYVGTQAPATHATSTKAPMDTAKGTPLQLLLGAIDLEHTNLNYSSETAKMTAGVKLKKWLVTVDSIDVEKNNFLINTILIDSTALTYDNNKVKRVKQGIDYNHLKVDSLKLSADHLGASVSANNYYGNITRFSFGEQSGIVLRQLSAGLRYSDTAAHINQLHLLTNRTQIDNQTDARYPSMDQLIKHPETLFLRTQFTKTYFSIRDLLTFVPTMAGYFKGKENGRIDLETKMEGQLSRLQIPVFNVKAFNHTALSLRGSIQGLPKYNSAFYNLTILKLATDSADYGPFIPKGSLPANIHLPYDLSATGTYAGTFNAGKVNLVATTSKGGARVNGQMNLKAQTYDGAVGLQTLDLGYILGQSQNLGTITLDAKAIGQSFSFPNLKTNVEAQLHEGTIKGYTYHDLTLNAQYDHGEGNLHSDINDSAIHYDLDAIFHNVGDKLYPSVQLTLNLDTIDARALHLINDTLQASGLLEANFDKTNPDSLDGKLTILHTRILTGDHHLHTDSLDLVAIHRADSQYLHLYTPMANADLNGRYALTQIGGALIQTINHYYNLPGVKDSAYARENWLLHLQLIPNDPMVLNMVPGLKGSDTLGLTAHFQYDSIKNGNLEMAMQAPLLVYGADTLTKVQFHSHTQDSALNYRFQVASVSVGSSPLHETDIYGKLEHNALYTTALLKDAKNKEWYMLGAKVQQSLTPDSLRALTLNLNPDSLLLNHMHWDVSKDNAIYYDSTGILVHNLVISHDNQSLKISSLSNSPSSPIKVDFNQFRLGWLTTFTSFDTALVDGTVQGNAQVDSVLTNPVFTSDLTIHNLAYKADTVGDLTLKVNNTQPHIFAADLGLEGKGNDLSVKGQYATGDGHTDMTLHIGSLNMAIAKPFSAGQLDDIKGKLKGDLHITGTLDKPVPNGNLYFDSAYIVPNITGEPLRLSNDRIEFDNTGFNFSQFELLDSAGDKARLDGNVNTTDFRNYAFDLTFYANNFRLVNARQANDRMFYGKLNMDAVLNLKGSPDLPKMDGVMKVNKQTDFTFVLPETNPELVSRVGVVRFVDPAHPADTLLSQYQLDSLQTVTPAKGININANVSTDSSARFTMVIDQRNGDALKVRGRADLNFSMDESGKTTLTGNYEIDEGSYALTLSLLKRNFMIQRGSTLTWTGDPSSARVNITANYPIMTAPIDLVQDEIAGRSTTDINKFKQQLPFTVSLKMGGELLKPDITFDITLPSSYDLLWPDVTTKLQQLRSDPSEMNKQAFAVLLLGHFVGDNPLVSAAGSQTAGQMAFQSASQLLTGQLNQLAASLIKGVDINFGLTNTQDYTTGTENDRTDLNVTVSKRFMNDRIQVNVGTNVEVAGATNPGENTTNIGGDISVDYQLSKDGRYRVRAYRKDQYDYIVEGQVVETGISFILTLDYNRFRELFEKAKNAK